jgi:hypothetical protein
LPVPARPLSRYLLPTKEPPTPCRRNPRRSDKCIRTPTVLGTNRIGAPLCRRGQARAHYRNGRTHRLVVGRSERTCDENASTCTQASRRPPVRNRTSYIAGIAEPTHPVAEGHTRRSSSAGSARGLSNRNRDRSTSRQLRSQPANHPRYTEGDPSTEFDHGLGTESDQGAEFCGHDYNLRSGWGNAAWSALTIPVFSRTRPSRAPPCEQTEAPSVNRPAASAHGECQTALRQARS